MCPPDCGRPPIGKPVATNPWFTSSDGKFAVQSPRAGTAYDLTVDADGVEVNFTAGDTVYLTLTEVLGQVNPYPSLADATS